MEINQEALDALSLADILALRNELSDALKATGNPRLRGALLTLEEQYRKRFRNIFIF